MAVIVRKDGMKGIQKRRNYAGNDLQIKLCRGTNLRQVLP
jgi:hypothetical protein